MLRLIAVAVLLGGCTVDLDFDRVTIDIEPFSPPLPGGGEPVVLARGATLLTARHISRDGGASWAQVSPFVYTQGAQATTAGELVVTTTTFGIGRWDLATDQVVSIDPPWSLGTWHARATRTILLTGTTGQLARQTADGTWSYPTFPEPSPPTPALQIHGVVSSDDVVLAIANRGVYRSTDDGASFELAHEPATLPFAWVALDDGFLLFAQDRVATVLDGQGVPTGEVTPPFPTFQSGLPIACLGAVVLGGQYSTDLGATWTPLVSFDTPRSLVVTSTTCGGDFLVMHVQAATSATPQWLIRVDELGRLGPAYAFGPGDAISQFLLTADGTILANDMGWRPGDAAWTVRVLPAAEVHVLQDGSLYAPTTSEIYRSTDGAVSWERTPLTAPLPAAQRFLADSTGTMWASAGDYDGGWYRARLWRSDDGGVTWTEVFDRTATDPAATDTTLVAPRLVAIASGDVFVATSFNEGLHVSHDLGATWESLPFPNPYTLAFVTHGGVAATLDPIDEGYRVWHLWRDHGLGKAYRQVTIRVDGLIADLSQVGLYAQLDASDRVYMLGGGAIYRSTQPLR